MFMKKAVPFLLGLLMTLIPAMFSAQDDSLSGRWWRMPAMASRVEVSPSERDALDKLFMENRKVLMELRDDLEQERFRLDDILDQQKFNERAAMDQFRKMEKKRERLSLERFRYLLQVRKILGNDRYRELMTCAREMRRGRYNGQERGMPYRGGR